MVFFGIPYPALNKTSFINGFFIKRSTKQIFAKWCIILSLRFSLSTILLTYFIA